MFTVTLPPVPLSCSKCNRPLNGRVDSGWFPWSVPVLTGGVHVCSMCDEDARFPISERTLPETSVKALEAYRNVRIGHEF